MRRPGRLRSRTRVTIVQWGKNRCGRSARRKGSFSPTPHLRSAAPAETSRNLRARPGCRPLRGVDNSIGPIGPLFFPDPFPQPCAMSSWFQSLVQWLPAPAVPPLEMASLPMIRSPSSSRRTRYRSQPTRPYSHTRALRSCCRRRPSGFLDPVTARSTTWSACAGLRAVHFSPRCRRSRRRWC